MSKIYKIIGTSLRNINERTFSDAEHNYQYYIFSAGSANNHWNSILVDTQSFTNAQVFTCNKTVNAYEFIEISEITSNSFKYALADVSDYQKQYGTMFCAYGVMANS